MIVGAGIHGLSTAWHLATELRERGLGDGGDVLVLDKAHIGAGASGVACGVIRRTGVTVTGMQMANGRVTAVGPWVRDL
ncbi:MAG TPA: FAD-dependent oxidoreductase [Actinomycetospora sp.]|nr:FAD-dependent oxidoreductase [Actinomycetospora sp.]